MQRFLALPETHRHAGQGAQFHAAGGHGHQMRRDTGQIHQQDPDHLGPPGNLDAQQLFDGHAVRGLVEGRREVVGAGDEGDALRPVAELAGLLDPGVQVADHRSGLHHRLALDLQDQPEHAVGGRVLGPHVHDDAFVAVTAVAAQTAEVALGQHVLPVPTGDGEDPAFRRRGAPGQPGFTSSQVFRQEILGVDRLAVDVVRGRHLDTSFLTTAFLEGPGFTNRTCADRGRGSRRPGTRPGCRPAGNPCAAGGPPSRPASGSWSARGARRR